MTALLEIHGLEVRYGEIPALRNIDLTVEKARATALLGANGAGKSTLMKAVIGLLRPSAGTIHFKGSRIEALGADRRARLGIGYSPEGRRTFPGLTVRENLEVGCWAGSRECRDRVERMFALFPALGRRPGDRAWQLSGGQQQMLSIGRSLMKEPDLLLLDEPSVGLSPRLTEDLLARIPEIVAVGTAVLLAEQNAAKALAVCDRAILLQGGRIVEDAPAAALGAGDRIRRAFLGG